ncbi:ribosome binding protein [Babesia caballi]|uniref:Ribosome binding protein n=1 Tax=Babesia caballi TaxID=5871 RepID=A0AAV4LQ87_BABCB|nr:ribosome binding protein [Babesia caballi]
MEDKAIDWILRVTGKDGQGSGSQEAIKALTEQVKKLLTEVNGAASGLGEEFTKVKEALDGSGNGDLIGKLPMDFSSLLGMRVCVGTGQVPKGFGTLVDGIAKKVENNSGFQSGVRKSLKTMFKKLKAVIETANLENGGSGRVELFKTHVDSFLSEAFGKVKGEDPSKGPFTNFTNLCTQLSKLFKDNDINSGFLSTSDALKVMERPLQGSFTSAKNAANHPALTGEINNLKDSQAFTAAVFSSVRDAAQAVVGDLTTKTYTSYYSGAENKDIYYSQCTKIFLGCLSLYYHALTYLYWRCDQGGWGTLSLGGGSNTYSLREFMGSMAFADGIINTGKNGTALVGGALNYVCKTNAKVTSTIREMLYFLAALPYTAVYDELDEHITSSLNTPLPVAVSGSAIINETLSSSDLLGILVASSLSAPWVLGTIEGRGNSNNPLLRDLYCNGMGFAYPSGPTLLNSLSNYAYALQFQLSFLYQQCSGTYSKACGWNECLPDRQAERFQPRPSFGSVQPPCNLFRIFVPCSDGFRKSSQSRQQLSGNRISVTLKPLCGSCNTPLCQLSKKLGCLTRRTSRTLGDVFGFLWHLNDQMFKTRPKMQELAKKLVNALGANISQNVPTFMKKILEGIAPSPLPTPPPAPSPYGLSRSLEAMAPTIPFLYQLFMTEDYNSLPGTLFDLNQHCHKYETSGVTHNFDVSIRDHKCLDSPSDLWSLYNPVYEEVKHKVCRDKNCGGYLYPLTNTFGSAFAPKHASSYLSWFIHLADDLEAGLREILERFKGLS